MKDVSPVDGFKEYLSLEKGFSEHTVNAYLRDLKKFLRHLEEEGGDKDVHATEAADIRSFIKELGEMGISIATQARTVSSLKAFFRYLLLEEEIDADPTSHIQMPKAERKFPDVLTTKEVEEVLARIELSGPKGYRDRAIVETLYGCGVRVSELTSLRISDVHFDEGYIRVLGKGEKERLVPLGPPTARAIVEYLENGRMDQKVQHRHEDILFLNQHGKALSRVMIFNIVRKTAKDAQVAKKVSPHTYRHSFATHLVEGGADLIAVKEMLGHVSVRTTEIYSHLDRQFLREELIQHHPRGKE